MINFKHYLQNINLQLLFFLFAFYLIVEKFKKSQNDFKYIHSSNSEEFLKKLKISNPFYEIFICFIYVFLTSLELLSYFMLFA